MSYFVSQLIGLLIAVIAIALVIAIAHADKIADWWERRNRIQQLGDWWKYRRPNWLRFK